MLKEINKAIILAILLTLSFSNANAIKHRFIVVDESRSQLHYVDQFDSSNDWTINFPERYRDVRLLNNQHILVSTYDGYEEYEIRTQKKIKTVANSQFNKTETITRLGNGHTILGCNLANKGGVKFFEIDENDILLRSVSFPSCHTLRLMSLTTDGSFLFGSTNRVVKANWDGVTKEFSISNEKRHIYEVEELENGNYRVSSGYGATLEEWTPYGVFVRKIAGGKPVPEGYNYFFFGRAQLLLNGHWVVSNWTGHGENDSQKGAQLIEFDQDGEIVWSWHDPKRSGTVHGHIILD